MVYYTFLQVQLYSNVATQKLCGKYPENNKVVKLKFLFNWLCQGNLVERFKGTVIQIEKALINDWIHLSKVS